MEEPEKKRAPLFTRRRAVVLLLLAAIIGCGAVAVCSLRTILARQRAAERLAAERSVDARLAVARRLADGYIAGQLEAREKLRRQLNRQAVALCGEIQVFLQSALVGREARRLQVSLSAERRRGRQLREIAEEQQKTIDQLVGQSLALEQFTVDEPAISADSADAGKVPPGGDKSVQDDKSPAKNMAQPLARAEDDATAADSSSSAAAKIPASDQSLRERLARLNKDTPQADEPEWAEKLLQECSLDFRNLLPTNCSLVVTEVGKQVLLTFGDGAVRDGEVRGTASLPLMVRSGEDYRQWMLTLTLASVDAPALPTPDRLARFLGEQLHADHDNLRGFVLGAEGRKIAAVFPEVSGAVRPLLPANRVWVEVPEAERAMFYRTLDKPSANPDYPWKLGLQVVVPQPDDPNRIGTLMAAHPWSVGGFIGGCLLLLAAFVAAAVLGWSSSAPVYVATDAVSSAGREKLVPELGSLARLQSANRQNAAPSRIVATSRSRMLRDLAARVSPPEKSVTKGLREYR